MSITQKNIVDDIKNLVSKFNVTDENRLNNDWLPLKIDEVRAQLIVQKYKEEMDVDSAWLTDLGLVTFHAVNFSDDVNVSYCGCPVSKAYIPQTINLPTKSINQDTGIQIIMSACGKYSYYYRPLAQWMMIPKEHTYSNFNYYARINTALYAKRKENVQTEQLRIVAILLRPEDGYYVQSAPIESGSIVSGTEYIVKFGQIAYDSAMIDADETFTGTSATTFAGSGKVYLADQKMTYRDTYPYPVSADMARQITIEICTKEFNIERGLLTDIRNDSKDDAQKS